MEEIEGNKNKTSGSLAMHFNEDFNDSVGEAEHMGIISVMFAIENQGSEPKFKHIGSISGFFFLRTPIQTIIN